MARKTYTDEQKAAAIAKVDEIGVTKAAKELSISATTLINWQKAAAQDVPAEKAAAPAEAPAEKKEETPVKTAKESAKKAIKSARATVKKGAKKLTEKATEVKKAVVQKEEEVAKKDAPAKQALLTPAKQEKLIAENAVLKEEVANLKAENARLKKAITDLTK